MKYVEISIEEAIKRCKKNAKVLVAEQDLEREDCDCNSIFVSKAQKDYEKLFSNIQTAASLADDFINQLRLFTECQDIYNIKPKGVQKIVLLKE